ncbi:MAG: hypothetical protein QOJ60_2517 [Actinomycetota bacterium]|jgi:hypothetical protein|nr:hypothetical protein [Actinomycetota bacterium]
MTAPSVDQLPVGEPPAPSARVANRLQSRAARIAATLLVGLAACALALTGDPKQPVLLLAGFAAAAVVAAVATGWRMAGSSAVLLVTVTTLGAASIVPRRDRSVETVVACGLLLLLCAGLDSLERGDRGPLRDSIGGPAWGQVLPVYAAALAATAAVAAVAARPGSPSFTLVLVGLAAAVGAMLVATRGHRRSAPSDSPAPRSNRTGPRARRGDDEKSLPDDMSPDGST